MIVLTDKSPEFCPECGKKISSQRGEISCVCHICESCGCAIQEVSAKLILDISEEIGGLLQFLDIDYDDSISELNF